MASHSDNTEIATKIDLFFNGRLHLEQPVEGHYLGGLDGILAAASLPKDFDGHLIDMGSGIGLIGICASARTSASAVTFVEKQVSLAAINGRNVQQNCHLFPNTATQILQLDICASEKERRAAGLKRNFADHILINPPYFSSDQHRPSPKAGRATAHTMPDGGLDLWIRAAMSALKSNGGLTIIWPATDLVALLNCLTGRIGGLSLFPIYPRRNATAVRVVITGRVGSRGPVSLEHGLILHEDETGKFLPKASAILNGELGLYDLR